MVAALDPGTIPRLNETRLDVPVLLFSIAISLVTSVVFGLAPALHLSRPDRATAFRGTRVRSLFTAAEVALALVLLVGAGVLIRGFIKVSNVSRGFNPENVLTFELALPEARYSAARRMQLGEEFLRGASRGARRRRGVAVGLAAIAARAYRLGRHGARS